MRLLLVLRLLFPGAVRARIRSLLFRWLDLRWTTPRGIELRVESYNDWVIHHEVFVDGEYDPAITRAIASADPTRRLRVLDLGAHAGYFTLRVFDRARQALGADAQVSVVAVEGRHDTADKYRRRVLGENHLQSSVDLFEGLVGRREGTTRIHLDVSPGTSSIMVDVTRPSTPVPFVDVSTLVEQDRVIDLIKCDIEGAELMFVEHHPDVLRKARIVMFELHHRLCDVARCRALLHDLGFTEIPGLRSNEEVSLYLGVRHTRDVTAPPLP